MHHPMHLSPTSQAPYMQPTILKLRLHTAHLLLAPPPVQASGVLPAGSQVSALLLGDLGAMPVPEAPAPTVLP